VVNTPVDPAGTPGTLCGLAYPFQRGYRATPAASYSPPDGEIFDEIYFAVFAHDDLKGISYFDPEPPLAKLLIAAGEWTYGEWRIVFEGAHGNPADLGFTPFGWRWMGSVFGCNFNHGRTTHVQPVTGGRSTHKRRTSHLLTHLNPSLRAFPLTAWTRRWVYFLALPHQDR